MSEIYMDNAATTRVRPEVAALMKSVMEEDYGNPSSMHTYGLKAENLVKEAARRAADSLKVSPKEIIFNSGGTEGNNSALIGTALRAGNRGRHIISTGLEHPSVRGCLTFLKSQGFETDLLGTDSRGRVDLSELENLMRPDTILVSVMLANNETGVIEDLAAVSGIVKKANPRTVLHSDAVQAFGKLGIRPRELCIDIMTVSAHKIHGPKGVGFMYLREGTAWSPLLYGGGQQRDMRPGTENVPGIAGLGLAASLYAEERSQITGRMRELKNRLISGLCSMEGVFVHTGQDDAEFLPSIVSASFEGVKAEVLLHALEEKGIYVSSGSACSSHHPGVSETLRTIGVRQDLLDSTLRFSFGIFNEPGEADEVSEALAELLPRLRLYRRK